jgi:hypothetical protein
MPSEKLCWNNATTTNVADASGGVDDEKLIVLIQALKVNVEKSLTSKVDVANTVGTVVGSETESSANPNASAEAGTNKYEDELPYDGCTEGLAMNPKVEGKEAQLYLFGQLQTVVKENRMTMDHASVYKTFVNKVLEKR